MLATCWMAVGLFQSQVDQVDSVRRIDLAQAVVAAQAAVVEQEKTARAEDERRQFEKRLQRLAAALSDFQREYEASGGQVWPKKQADALKKAIHAVHLR